VSGVTKTEAPKAQAPTRQVGSGMARGPLPSRLGGLGERRELPQRRYRILCML